MSVPLCDLSWARALIIKSACVCAAKENVFSFCDSNGITLESKTFLHRNVTVSSLSRGSSGVGFLELAYAFNSTNFFCSSDNTIRYAVMFAKMLMTPNIVDLLRLPFATSSTKLFKNAPSFARISFTHGCIDA